MPAGIRPRSRRRNGQREVCETHAAVSRILTFSLFRRNNFMKLQILAASVIAAAVLAGCGKKEEAAPAAGTAAPAAPSVIRIGHVGASPTSGATTKTARAWRSTSSTPAA
jgi:hypothetical protein